MSTLLAETVWTWGALADKLNSSGNWGWLSTLLGVVDTILWVVLILVGAVGAIYAVYVGVKMARADSAEAREESKKRLINIIVSIAVTAGLILFFNILLPVILSSLGVFGDLTTQGAAIETVRAIIGR